MISQRGGGFQLGGDISLIPPVYQTYFFAPKSFIGKVRVYKLTTHYKEFYLPQFY